MMQVNISIGRAILRCFVRWQVNTVVTNNATVILVQGIFTVEEIWLEYIHPFIIICVHVEWQNAGL